jgi:hypothetical protein
MSANASNTFDRARWLATLHAEETFVLKPAGSAAQPVPPRQRCQDCGGRIHVVRFLRFRGSASFDSS